VLTGWIGGLGIDAANPECHRPGSCMLMARVFWALVRMLGGPVGLVVEPGAGARGRRRLLEQFPIGWVHRIG
jgi:hypothetical protein